jgi:hypothetical protein
MQSFSSVAAIMTGGGFLLQEMFPDSGMGNLSAHVPMWKVQRGDATVPIWVAA